MIIIFYFGMGKLSWEMLFCLRNVVAGKYEAIVEMLSIHNPFVPCHVSG